MPDERAGQPEEMAAEFDTVAEWTLRAVRRLGQDHALPAACRGGGTPAALNWLARRLDIDPGPMAMRPADGRAGYPKARQDSR